MKKIIINADDYGINTSKTHAILKCFENGWIDTATIMCNILESGCFEYAIASIKKTIYSNQIGIHYCLSEGKPLTKKMRESSYFCDSEGNFRRFNRNKILSRQNRLLLFDELSAQTERFLNTGLEINHIDSHHHIHTGLGMIGTFKRVMRKYGIKKIRISRNIYSKPSFFKQLTKTIFNFIFIDNKVKFSKYFCSIEDAIHINIKDKTEIMCHPDLNEHQEIVDNKGKGKEQVLLADYMSKIQRED